MNFVEGGGARPIATAVSVYAMCSTQCTTLKTLVLVVPELFEDARFQRDDIERRAKV